MVSDARNEDPATDFHEGINHTWYLKRIVSLNKFTKKIVHNFLDENMIGETMGTDALHEDPAADLHEGIKHLCYL